MKTIDLSLMQPDAVIAEVRRVKTGIAAKHHFDVMEIVRALQERERKEKCEAADPLTVTPDRTSN